MAGGVNLTIGVAGTAEVAALFQRAHPSIRAKLRDAIRLEALALEDAARVAIAAMLEERTGRLSRGMTHRLGEGPTSIGATVWNRAQRGRYRYGFMLAAGRMTGFARVETHQRRVRSRDVRARVARAGRVRRRIVSKGFVTVRSHKRPIRLPARGFIGAAFNSRKAAAQRAIEIALSAGLAEVRGFDSGGGI